MPWKEDSVSQTETVESGRSSQRRSFTEVFSAISDVQGWMTRHQAERLWDAINGPNLRENIAPTRGRASLVLRKDADHSVRRVRLRKL